MKTITCDSKLCPKERYPDFNKLKECTSVYLMFTGLLSYSDFNNTLDSTKIVGLSLMNNYSASIMCLYRTLQQSSPIKKKITHSIVNH